LSFGVGPSLKEAACLSMRVELTEAGETERYGEVLETCFEAVGALRRDLDNAQTGARLWSELAAIDRATFDFASSRRSAYSTCSTLARTLHDVDGAHVLCGGRPGLCGDADWSPQRSALLSTLVASLADPSKIIVHVATKEPSVALETERWYGVEHGSRPLTREELESYGEAVRRGLTATDLGAPAENPFLPDAERLRLARPAWRDSEDKDAVRRAASAAPPRRRTQGRLVSWWKKDATFGQPKAYAHCRVTSEVLGSGGARGRACTLLWVNLALENLEKPLYAATCAGLSYDVSDAFFESGVDLYVGGLAGGALCGKTIRCVNGGAP
jgi:secreted Zn-dependent insulinase-like peptidase